MECMEQAELSDSGRPLPPGAHTRPCKGRAGRDCGGTSPARPCDGPVILALYRSLIGLPGTTWNEYYPGPEEVERDIARGSLWCLWGPDGTLWGAASLGEDDPDIRDLSCWAPAANSCELTRVGILKDLHGRGLGEEFVRCLLRNAAREGRDMARLLAGSENPAALRLYEKLGFAPCGGTRMYDVDWVCMEKKLSGL